MQRLREDVALLCVGIVESSFKISLELFLFIWTPLLEETTGSYVNPGAVYTCFMIARLIGSELFESVKILMRTNSYLISVGITSTSALAFFISFIYADFTLRFWSFTYFDVLL